MVPNISGGSSFMGAGMYYLHDKRGEEEKARGEVVLTDERVEWTHTLNCAADEPWAALKEMRSTADNQNMLKAAAGIRQGRPIGDPVKTVSLAWHPEQDPSKETMIEAAESYLKAMGWQEHQVLLTAHNDEPQKHVHLVINRVHPVTGRTLDDHKDYERGQRWGHEYQKEHGEEYCPDRAAKYEHGVQKDLSGVPHPVHQSWEQKRRGLDTQLEAQKEIDAHEWDILKQLQRDERDAFRAESQKLEREARLQAYRDVRDEFKPHWREFFELQDKTAIEDKEAVAKFRNELQKSQSEALDLAQEEAIKTLRDERGDAYQEMLKRHREEKADLASDQQNDISRYDLLAQAYPNRAAEGREAEIQPELSGPSPNDLADAFLRDTGPLTPEPSRGENEPEPREAGLFEREEGEPNTPPGAERGPRKDAVEGLAWGGLGALSALADSLTGVTKPSPAQLFARMQDERDNIDAAREQQAQQRRQDRADQARDEQQDRDRDDWYERTRDRDR